MRAPTIAGIVAAGALLATALFFGDGTSGGRLFWIGSLSVIAAVVLLWTGRCRFPGAGAAALALLAALDPVGRPDDVVVDRARPLVGGVRSPARLPRVRAPRPARRPGRAPARTVAARARVLVGLVLAWALLGKVIPSLFPDGARVARLRNPVGYWNSLALVAATAVPLGLWVASRGHPREAGPPGRFSSTSPSSSSSSPTRVPESPSPGSPRSRGWRSTRDRLETLVALVSSTPVAGLVVLWTFSRPALTDDLQPYADRVNDGAWFGILVLPRRGRRLGLAYLAARAS